MKKERFDKNLIGLAGEYHVLAQLAERGIVGALTLGHTKGVDILAHNPRTGALRRVEVKTTRAKPGSAALWNQGTAYSWTMSVKHEALKDEDLVYCFVHLTGPNCRPSIFVVPAREVARYVKWQHQKWFKSRKPRVAPAPQADNKDNTLRVFRVEVTDPAGYQDNWGVFE